MTSDTDRIEELAELIMWLNGQAIQERNQRKPTDLEDWRENQARWLNEHAENLRSLSVELTEWKIRCAELEQNAAHIQSSDEAEDLKRSLIDCNAELTKLRKENDILRGLLEKLI